MELIAPHLAGVLIALGIVCLGLMSPGSNVLAVIGTSMAIGRAEALALALGVALGTFLWALLAWAGLVALIATYAAAMMVIKLAGAAYLFWLAIKAFRSAARKDGSVATDTTGLTDRAAYFRRGLTVQMTNPKAALAWVATMSVGLGAGAPLWAGAAIVIGATVLSVVAHAAYAVAFSTGTAVRAYRRLRRWIEAGLGAFFCFAGFKLLTTRTG